MSKLKDKGVLLFGTYILLSFLLAYTGYLYSIRCDYVFWGNRHRDGLYFLAYIFYVLPAMAFVSFLRLYLWRRIDFIQFSSAIYTTLTVIFAILYNYFDSQKFILLSMTSCFILAIINSFEMYIFIKKKFK